MRVFAAADLQRNPAEILKAASVAPIFLTYHDKPRYVMMSLEEFAKIQGKRIVASTEAFPPSVMARIRELENAFPNAKGEIVDGLASALEEEASDGPLNRV
jgi:hypothetical protein